MGLLIDGDRGRKRTYKDDTERNVHIDTERKKRRERDREKDRKRKREREKRERERCGQSKTSDASCQD